MAQFHKAVKHKQLLSTEKILPTIQDTSSELKYHVVYIGFDWFPAHFCLAEKNIQFLLMSFMTLGMISLVLLGPYLYEFLKFELCKR